MSTSDGDGMLLYRAGCFPVAVISDDDGLSLIGVWTPMFVVAVGGAVAPDDAALADWLLVVLVCSCWICFGVDAVAPVLMIGDEPGCGLNQVSPIHAGPSRILFCCLLLMFLNIDVLECVCDFCCLLPGLLMIVFL